MYIGLFDLESTGILIRWRMETYSLHIMEATLPFAGTGTCSQSSGHLDSCPSSGYSAGSSGADLMCYGSASGWTALSWVTMEVFWDD